MNLGQNTMNVHANRPADVSHFMNSPNSNLHTQLPHGSETGRETIIISAGQPHGAARGILDCPTKIQVQTLESGILGVAVAG
jgi:hypothetical protein